MLAGATAFKLYDTYGFPLDLTQDALRGRGIGVDVEGFKAMEQQRAEARKAWAGSGEAATEIDLVRSQGTVGATEFLGYATERAEGVIAGLLKDGREVQRLGGRGNRASDPQPNAILWRIVGQVGEPGSSADKTSASA